MLSVVTGSMERRPQLKLASVARMLDALPKTPPSMTHLSGAGASSGCGGAGGKWKARLRFMFCMSGATRLKSSLSGERVSCSSVQPLKTMPSFALRVSRNLGMRSDTWRFLQSTLTMLLGTDLFCRSRKSCVSSTPKRCASDAEVFTYLPP